MTELWRLSALELAERIRKRETTSREVIEAHLARIEMVNSGLNAVVRRLDAEARAAATAADEALDAGVPLGPFHGVPFTSKENIDLAGHPTTRGVPALAEAVAGDDAPTTSRMRRAGAIPLARTNLPDLGLRVHTDSTLHGLTRNPWDPSVTAGGSSGGEGSAIAAGMSPLGLGNDFGGSLRNPASCCGIVTLKPSVGLIPMATSVPPRDLMLAGQMMVVEGPLARTVADVRAATEVLAGPHVADPRSAPVRIEDSAPGERLTIAVMPDPPGGSTAAGVAGAVRSVADLLSDAGHEVVEADLPGYEEAIDLWGRLFMTEYRPVQDLISPLLGDDARTVIGNLDRTVPEMDPAAVQLLHAERFAVMRAASAFFAEHRIVITPTWAHRPFGHDADTDPELIGVILDTIRTVLVANLLGAPAVSLPAGVVDGLPVGVQVMGDRFTDLRCLTVAEEIEQMVGTFTPIDPVWEQPS